MREVSRRISGQSSPAAIVAPPGDEKMVQAILEFLVWIENIKGLTLCQAFKPQYDWYMPAFDNKERLAREFLAKQPASTPQETQGEERPK